MNELREKALEQLKRAKAIIAGAEETVKQYRFDRACSFAWAYCHIGLLTMCEVEDYISECVDELGK